ncbi:hypothetical protein AWB68_06496 [Caballeronia choica]|jgi:hypothetical protein|uniref:Uncharacterized protein n=1 Tax=Caballeronia choica TaxID=326476 RepID=A0A158KP61_9BURK|nr:hypothetical protein [Caballeronia choica]SAL82380.1 hypothetical protein AWB68_06496 [Caballeronia choica]
MHHIDLLQVLRENWLLLALPVCAAAIGHAIGRLVRGRGYDTP